MKLLPDENVPRQIKPAILNFEGNLHSVFTVADQGWKGKLNGELLKAMMDANFDAPITADKNIEHQQNFK